MSRDEGQRPQPVFRWAGSKRKLLSVLMASCPTQFNTYVEPFVGSACLYFSLRPHRALLADVNLELINAYSAIKSHPYELHQKLTTYEVTSDNYYRLRALNPNALAPIDAAVRFIYLNRLCFNGVYRTNMRGQFNVPLGSKPSAMPSLEHLLQVSLALKPANLIACDFEEALANVEDHDFVYLDPPYAIGRRYRGEYGPGAFRESDVPRLLAALRSIDSRGATFLLSYAEDQALLMQLPSAWYLRHVDVQRHIAGFAVHRRLASEILISNRPLLSGDAL
jgi:DNA adenine methylase